MRVKIVENNNELEPLPEVVNHGVRKLAYGFVTSIVAGILLTTSVGQKLKMAVGTEIYGQITVFASLFLPLIVNWTYNKIVRRNLHKKEVAIKEQIANTFTEDDIEKLTPSDKELVKKSLDKKSIALKQLKTIKQSQESL